LERLQRAQQMLEVMEDPKGLGYRQVGALFGVSVSMSFKLIKELKAVG